jgi:hypothetical protein
MQYQPKTTSLVPTEIHSNRQALICLSYKTIRWDGKTMYDIDILIAEYYKTLKNDAYFELDGSIVPLPSC